MRSKKDITVFVMMPFGVHDEYRDGVEESDYIYNEMIKPALEEALSSRQYTYHVHREVDKNTPGAITREIIRHIAAADIVIADLTGQNPNVFLELGVRFALRNKVTILLAQEKTITPFDISNYRTIFYKIVKKDNVICQIADAISVGLSPKRNSDSLVFDAFEEMSVVIPGYCESHSHATITDRTLMLWPEYWNRIEAICTLLDGPTKNGQFAPDVVMGISNGGLVVADLIGRAVFRGTPILGLWADRYRKPPGDSTGEGFWYFENEYNNALVEIIKNKVEGRNAVFLILDDHLGTGTTALQVKNYLKAQFDGKVDILYIPMFSKRPEYIDVVEDLFPYKFGDGKIFVNVEPGDFLRGMTTGASHFPYRKEISGA